MELATENMLLTALCVVMPILMYSGLFMAGMRKFMINPMMDGMMFLMASSETGGMKAPLMAKMMQPIMRYMMDGSMHITAHYNDCTYKEVQDFMVPSSVGKPFLDLPGTFDKGMRPRMTDIGFFQMMTMDRKVRGALHANSEAATSLGAYVRHPFAEPLCVAARR